jgi:hypothetical protein
VQEAVCRSAALEVSLVRNQDVPGIDPFRYAEDRAVTRRIEMDDLSRS